MRPIYSLANYLAPHWLRSPSIVIRRRGVIAVTLVIAVLGSWSVASAWYFMWRDEVALKLLEKQTAQKRLYEDRLAVLRTKLERVLSERLAEHEVLENRLKILLERQATLESRQAQIDPLTVERTGSVEPKFPPAHPVEASVQPPSPSLLDLFQLRLKPTEPPTEQRSRLYRFKHDLDQASSTLAFLEAEQVRTLHELMKETEIDSLKLQAAIRKAGLDPSTFETAEISVGGPLIPAKSEGKSFDILLLEAQESITRLQHLRHSVTALPFGEPISSGLDLSSNFGTRVDPFTRSQAMHTGIDIRAKYGTSVHATGAGRIVTAEYSGAYGKMVEIEHASGVTSRYAHLSNIAVSVDQDVRAGTVVGHVGSTGRSTGPHLHYETRLNGNAVDPQQFLKAGAIVSTVVAESR